MHQNESLKQKHSLITMLVLFSFVNIALADSYYFFVQFTDKNNSPYSLDNPSQFLSTRAIQRRNEQQITIDSTDLPVNPDYISLIANQGVAVHSCSKWINGVTILTTDSSLMNQIRVLPIVSGAQYTGKINSQQYAPRAKSKFTTDSFTYGSAAAQINQLNGKALHNRGYTGSGMLIGVLDAGFKSVDTNPAFDSLRIQHRIAGAISIIDPSINVYNEDSHGAYVMSIMAGNLPEQYLGVAPHASYWLIQTEHVPTEYLFETDFWVRGAEFADSVGVDVINSSLGYSEFDDASMNFTYADMNGTTSRASRAANMAAQKGILVCSSAGNEGNKQWKYISAPSDAEGILTVGAVTSSGAASYFSSFGPSADGRTKPEVCATGTSTAIIQPGGSVLYGNGTSFSSPIIAGLSACYMQFHKTQSPYTALSIRQNIMHSGSLYTNPSSQIGYGLPDFLQVINNTSLSSTSNKLQDKLFTVQHNALTNQLTIIQHQLLGESNCYFEMYSTSGTLIHSKQLISNYTAIDVGHLTPGIYITRISNHTTSQLTKIIFPK